MSFHPDRIVPGDLYKVIFEYTVPDEFELLVNAVHFINAVFTPVPTLVCIRGPESKQGNIHAGVLKQRNFFCLDFGHGRYQNDAIDKRALEIGYTIDIQEVDHFNFPLMWCKSGTLQECRQQWATFRTQVEQLLYKDE